MVLYPVDSQNDNEFDDETILPISLDYRDVVQYELEELQLYAQVLTTDDKDLKKIHRN